MSQDEDEESSTKWRNPSVKRRNLLRAGSVVVGAAGMAQIGSIVVPNQPTRALNTIEFIMDHLAPYQIMVAPQEDAQIVNAARELSSYLSIASGSEIQLHRAMPLELGGRNIIIGLTNRFENWIGASQRQLSEDDFLFLVEGESILLTANTTLAIWNGVSWFLEKFIGVRWWTPTEEFIPSHRKLTFSASDLAGEIRPRFQYRHLHYGECRDVSFRRHSRLNGRRDMQSIESREVPGSWSTNWPEEYPVLFRDLVTDNDLLQDENLKFMNERSRAQAVESSLAILRRNQKKGLPLRLGLIQADKPTWSPDPESRAFNELHGSECAAMIDFVNDVATRIAREIPEARFSTQAYCWSLKPPTEMLVVENVTITVCTFYANRGISIVSASNSPHGEYIEKWAGICNDLIVWFYQTSFSAYDVPYPQWESGLESIQDLAGIPQVRGVFVQGPWNTTGGEMAAMRCWTLAQKAWQPSRPTAEIMDEFLSGYYGPAAPYISRYMGLLRESVPARIFKVDDTSASTYPASAEMLMKADGILERAQIAVEDNPVLTQRVIAARFPLDNIILAQSQKLTRGRSRAGQLAARSRRMLLALRITGMNRSSDRGGDPEEVVRSYRVQGK